MEDRGDWGSNGSERRKGKAGKLNSMRGNWCSFCGQMTFCHQPVLKTITNSSFFNHQHISARRNIAPFHPISWTTHKLNIYRTLSDSRDWLAIKIKHTCRTHILWVFVRWNRRVVTLFNLLTQRVQVHFVAIKWRLQCCHLPHNARTMTNANQAPLPQLSKHRWYVLRLLSGAISSTWLYLYLYVRYYRCLM